MASKTFVLPLALVPALLAAADPSNQSWQRLEALTPADKIRVYTGEERSVRGMFVRWEPESLTVQVKGDKVVQLGRSEVREVAVIRKASRGRGALIGGAVGFGLGFPVGAAVAGQVADVNNPSAGTRVGGGAIFGAVFGGIGAGVGAATSGTKDVTLYRSK
jgi:hypothetical protein